MQLGEIIKQRRKELGYTLEKLGLYSFSSKSGIHDIESGKTLTPSFIKVMRIANALGVTAEYLYTGDDLSTSIEKKFFIDYKRLSHTDREILRKMIKILDNEND